MTLKSLFVVPVLMASLALPALASEWVGLAHPVAEVQVSPSVAGLVQRIGVRPGQSVKQGDVLLELESTVQQAELRRRSVILEDDSELKAASHRLAALNDLLQMTENVARNSQSVSREELIKLRMEAVNAEGRLQQLTAQKKRERVEHELALLEVSQRTVQAPMDGVVVDVAAKVGQWAKPGDVLLRLTDISQVELRLNLPQSVAAVFREGARMVAQFETASARVQSAGLVTFVSPVADSASGLVDVRVRFENPKGQIRPGAKAVIRGVGPAR